MLQPAAEEVDCRRGVEEDETVGREEEPFLFVWLEGQNCEPEVQWRKANGKADEGRRLAGDAIALVSDALGVVEGRDEEGRDGVEGEGK